jgi:hypothetical protein
MSNVNDPISPGDRDTLLLTCGHIFHLSGVNSECVGMYGWIKSNLTCPVCRTNFKTASIRIQDSPQQETLENQSETINIDIY